MHQNPDSLLKHKKKYVNDFYFGWSFIFYFFFLFCFFLLILFLFFSLYLYFYCNFVVAIAVCVWFKCVFAKLLSVSFFGPLVNRFLFFFRLFFFSLFSSRYHDYYCYYFGVQLHLEEVSMTGLFFFFFFFFALALLSVLNGFALSSSLGVPRSPCVHLLRGNVRASDSLLYC